MKIVHPKAEILSSKESIMEHLRICEAAGRTCYQSQEKINKDSYIKFLRGIVKSGHLSVIEHLSISARLICSRSCSHQVVRHRVSSFCLSGNTELIAFRDAAGRSQKKWTIEQLYSWQFDYKRKGKIKLIKIRSVDDNGKIVKGLIKKIIKNGKKETFVLKTKSGRSIRATENHRFLTENGYKRLSELKIGDIVIANGKEALENKEWLYDQYIVKNKTRKEISNIIGCCEALVYRAFKKYGIVKPRSNYPNRVGGCGKKGSMSEIEKEKLRKRMKGKNNPAYRGDNIGKSGGYFRTRKKYTADECWSCKTKEKLHIHHVDMNPKNIKEENIMFLCEKCHNAFHKGQGTITVFRDEIISIQSYGVEETYDLEMQNKEHNFVANGLVVHNSQASQRYINMSNPEIILPHNPLSEGSYFLTNVGWKNKDTNEVVVDANISNIISCIKQNFQLYEELVRSGIKKEDARCLLPNACATEIVMTCNFREWMHIFKERADNKHAQEEIRELFSSFKNKLVKLVPEIGEILAL